MIDETKLLDMSDEALLEIVRTHSPTNETSQGAKAALEIKNARRMAASSKRMEFATWVILFATVVQVFLFVCEHRRSVVPRSVEVAPQVALPDKAEEVKADTKTWEDAEIAVTCSGKKDLLASYSTDGKGKEVTRSCTIKNLTDKPVPLVAFDKVDALLRLPDGRVVRARHTYLGSSTHEIPARGQIEKAGLFASAGVNECPVKQSDYDCAQDELMQANELLLTDTGSGVRYHVRVE
jgi:hypothetical protein